MRFHAVALATCLGAVVCNARSVVQERAPLPSSETRDASATTAHTKPRIFTWFADYYYTTGPNQGQRVPILPIINEPSHITNVALFTIDMHTSSPNFTIGGVAPDNTTFFGPGFWQNVTKLQAAGVEVSATLGGSAPTCWSLLDQNFTAWYALLHNFIKKYGIQGIDLDIENDLTTQSQNTQIKLIKQLKSDFGSNFKITVAAEYYQITQPAGGSGWNLKTIDNQAVDSSGNHLIDFFDVQWYSGASCTGTSSYDSIVANGYAANRVVAAFADYSGDGGNYCTLSQCETMTTALTKKYSNFGGVGGWEYANAGMDNNLASWQWFQAMYNATLAGGAPA